MPREMHRAIFLLFFIALAVAEIESNPSLGFRGGADSRRLAETCSSIGDCEEDAEYCAAGECLEMGTCKTRLDCLNRANEYSTDDCVGYVDCEDGICMQVCSDFTCPGGSNPFNCFVRPCDVEKCDEPFEDCLDDCCGGCNAIFINAEGREVCKDSGGSTPRCYSDGDCQEGKEYCAGGVCRAHDTCGGSRIDCLNPANEVILERKCLGYVSCDDHNNCALACTGSNCPPGQAISECKEEPCKIEKCDEAHVSCKNDYCGGCHAIFFNAAGEQVCLRDCYDDDDCIGTAEYCAGGTCLAHGTCDGTVVDCLNPSNKHEYDYDCVGHEICNAGNQCEKVCGSSCPRDDRKKCYSPPCQVVRCSEPHVSCVDDYCGGCNAIFFNSAGEQVCRRKCDKDTDCIANAEFCSRGECRAHGSCGGTVVDCFNPANDFDIFIKCLGHLVCDKDDECGFTCGDVCPRGDKVECFEEPCKAVQCDEKYASCVNDYCGGCNAVFFDPAGNQICLRQCKEDNDCIADAEFCSQGVCRAFGACGNRLDCQNPSNQLDYPFEKPCKGYWTCSSSDQCEYVCSESSCPNNDNAEFECLASPCSVVGCDNKYTSCVDDYCGGCNAIFFNATGHQVCLRECEKDQDCIKGTEYCAAGVCRPHRTCDTDLDCYNPANDFPVLVDCVGYKSCDEDGECEFICHNSRCPNDDQMECLAAPCTATECDEPHVACVDNYCGGCNAMFFNSSGNQVCAPEAAASDNSPEDLSCEYYECTGSFLERIGCLVRRFLQLQIRCRLSF